MRHARFKIRNTKSEPRGTSHEARIKSGVTLIEMVVVVAIVVILATLVIGIASNIDNQSRKQWTKGTIEILDSALQQFKDYGYRYKTNPNPAQFENEFYQSLEFPLDCNLMPTDKFLPILVSSLGEPTSSPTLSPSVDEHDPNCSGSAVLYFFLSRVPQCRETLDRIDDSLITNIGTGGSSLMIAGVEEPLPFFWFIDAWQKPLRYDYYCNYYDDSGNPIPFDEMRVSIRTFPLITSAGPDKTFDTADDITNR